MSITIKYIVYEGEIADTCIMFPKWVSHHEMSMHRGKVLGAGFVDIQVTPEGVVYQAYGESTSLGIKSREEDSVLLNRQFGGTITT